MGMSRTGGSQVARGARAAADGPPPRESLGAPPAASRRGRQSLSSPAFMFGPVPVGLGWDRLADRPGWVMSLPGTCRFIRRAWRPAGPGGPPAARMGSGAAGQVSPLTLPPQIAFLMERAYPSSLLR